MISLREVKQYCQEYWKIENYQEAVNDQTQTWHCHHRHEIDWALPRKELIAIGRYYDVHYSELIFLTSEEHNRLHHKGKVGYWRGRKRAPFSEEWKQKMSDVNKGENNPNYKYYITEEELYDLYIGKCFTRKQLAKYFNCSESLIDIKLKKCNISKHGK